MSTVPYQNETKMTDLSGTHTTHDKSLPILTIIGGTVGHVSGDCYDITLLTKREGPHLLVNGRQTMKSGPTKLYSFRDTCVNIKSH